MFEIADPELWGTLDYLKLRLLASQSSHVSSKLKSASNGVHDIDSANKIGADMPCRRFVLQPSSLPVEMRLGSDLAELMHLCEQNASDRENPTAQSNDFADACLGVDGRIFR